MDLVKDIIKSIGFIILFSLPIFILDSDLIVFKFILDITGFKPFEGSVFWSFFAGVGTIGAIFITYFLYRTNQNQKEKAKINAIIDEIYHNLNIASMYYGSIENEEIQLIISVLNNLSDSQRYPNPTDAEINPYDHEFFDIYDGYDKHTFFQMGLTKQNFIPFKNLAITQAMATGEALILSKRIFLNLGHLNYSLVRLKLVIDRWNASNKNVSDSRIASELENRKRE
jgi:hypothetical protein